MADSHDIGLIAHLMRRAGFGVQVHHSVQAVASADGDRPLQQRRPAGGGDPELVTADRQRQRPDDRLRRDVGADLRAAQEQVDVATGQPLQQVDLTARRRRRRSRPDQRGCHDG